MNLHVAPPGRGFPEGQVEPVADPRPRQPRIGLALGGVPRAVHGIYFLHRSTRSEGGGTFMALIFTITLVVIRLAGSGWVMYHLNHNMMPMDAHDVMNNAR